MLGSFRLLDFDIFVLTLFFFNFLFNSLKARVEELYPDMKAALESIKQTDKKRPVVGSSKDDGAATKKRLGGGDDVNMEKI